MTNVYKEFVQLNNEFILWKKYFQPFRNSFMKKHNKFGLIITDELLKLLGEMFPDKLPNDLVSDKEMSRLIGQQDVIWWLKDKQEELIQENLEREAQVTIKT